MTIFGRCNLASEWCGVDGGGGVERAQKHLKAITTLDEFLEANKKVVSLLKRWERTKSTSRGKAELVAQGLPPPLEKKAAKENSTVNKGKKATGLTIRCLRSKFRKF